MSGELENVADAALRYYRWAEENHVRIKRFKIPKELGARIRAGLPLERAAKKWLVRINDIPVEEV